MIRTSLKRKNFVKENLKMDSSSSASSSAIYRKNPFNVLRDLLSLSHSALAAFSPDVVSVEVAHPVSTEHKKLTERTV